MSIKLNRLIRPFSNYAHARRMLNYTEPLLRNQYKISQALPVPDHIPQAPHYKQRLQDQKSDLNDENIHILSEDQQQCLKQAARKSGEILKDAIEKIEIGMTLDDIDKIVHDKTIQINAFPSCINFLGFPKSVCVSVNEVVTHGVPNNKVLEAGDYVNIDVTCYYQGNYGDTSAMAFVEDEKQGKYVHEDIKRLSQVTRESLFVAIDQCKPGVKFSKIGEIIEEYARSHGYFPNKEFGGHGISHKLHMPPLIQHYSSSDNSQKEMKPGMAFTIEPILMMKEDFRYDMWDDQWTITAPGIPSCQWEHIILITEQGREILTLREGEVSPFK